MKKTLAFFFLTLALNVQAVSLNQIPKIIEKPNILARTFQKIVKCTWHISCYSDKILGVSLYSITGTTLVSDLDTYIMQNDNALDAGKIENSTTTLPYLAGIGTITSGTWNATAISVSKGGTGTTSPSPYLVLLGDGQYGITHASTTGTTGQVFVSNGAGIYPSWQSGTVDQTLSYNWTGTTFRIKNLHASSTVANPLVLNGINISAPSVQPASSTIPVVSSTGDISFLPYNRVLSAPADVYTSYAGGIGATTTVFNTTLPASTFLTGGTIRVTINATSSITANASNDPYILNFNLSLGGNATATCGYGIFEDASATATSTWSFNIRANSSTQQNNRCIGFFPIYQSSNAKTTNWNAPGGDVSAGTNLPPFHQDFSSVQGTVNLANAQPLILEAWLSSRSTHTFNVNIFGVVAELLNI